MSPQRRTALVSIGAAAVLAALKLGAGLVSGSLGLISEALHSGTDLVAALLTFFAIGVSGRPADEGHQYGHGKAEHLAALAEATVLALVSVAVAALAVDAAHGKRRATRSTPAWWLFLVVAVVLAIDLSRTVISLRTARQLRERGPALERDPLRQRLRGHARGARRPRRRGGRLSRRATRSQRSSSPLSCSSPPAG